LPSGKQWHTAHVDGGTSELVKWTLTDHLNTVRDIARYDSQTQSTTVVNHLVYNAYGNVTAETNSAVESLFLFTARPFDPDTGLQNNLNRWYDPAVGRWLSEDPIGFAAGDGSLYRYVVNNTVTRLDLTGHQTVQLPGSVIIYPAPAGTFQVQIAIVSVVDPSQQQQLGEHAPGYIVRYTPAKGVCNRPCERITLTQAIQSGGFWAPPARFDSQNDPANADLVFPDYTGQRPYGPGSLADAPRDTRALSPTIHHVCICAICNTTLHDPSFRWKFVVQQILGCLTFDWRHREPPSLIIGGARYTLGQSGSFPGQNPGGPWGAALANLPVRR